MAVNEKYLTPDYFEHPERWLFNGHPITWIADSGSGPHRIHIKLIMKDGERLMFGGDVVNLCVSANSRSLQYCQQRYRIPDIVDPSHFTAENLSRPEWWSWRDNPVTWIFDSGEGTHRIHIAFTDSDGFCDNTMVEMRNPRLKFKKGAI